MEDKRGLKRECSPFTEESPTPNDAKTPPSASSVSPPSPGSPVGGVFSPPSLTVFEQGVPLGKALVVEQSSSSDEEDHIPNTSRDFEFTQRLYNELNCALLGPPDDGKVIIISDSDEKVEAHEETTAEARGHTFHCY
jgi:hypothetical protein